MLPLLGAGCFQRTHTHAPPDFPADKRVFRFEVFVTTKQLGEALALLSGRVTQITPPQLVANAGAGRNGVTPITSGRLVDLFARWLQQHKLKEFDNKKTREFLQSIGRAPGSASYLLTVTKQHGLIKNIGTGTESRWQLKAKPKQRKPKKTAPAKAAAAS